MSRMVMAALAAALSVLTGAASVAQDAAERDLGRAVFDTWCAACHVAGKPGSVALGVRYQGMRPASLEERTDLTPELTKLFVRSGISIMPPFRKTEITDEELDALAVYLAPE